MGTKYNQGLRRSGALERRKKELSAWQKEFNKEEANWTKEEVEFYVKKIKIAKNDIANLEAKLTF